MKAKKSSTARYSEALNRFVLLTQPVTIQRGEYDIMKQALLEDEHRVMVLVFEAMFAETLKEVRSMVRKFNIPVKAKLAYALGHIDETTLKDIKQIHDIRNEFYHGKPKSFANAGVCKICRKLSVAKDPKVTANDSYAIYIMAVAKHLSCLLKAQKKLKENKSPEK